MSSPANLRPLIELSAGETGRLGPSRLGPEDTAVLAALGLEAPTTIRLCQAGNPWIVQARGCRIGLTYELARQLMIEIP